MAAARDPVVGWASHEMTPNPSDPDSYDLAVIGGGFAGLCLARHVILARPGTRVVVIDRRALPGPASRRGVGESTSELAAWYLARRLQLHDLLEREQVVKYGLRFWLRAPECPSALAERIEFGPMGTLPAQLADVARLPEPPLRPHAYQLHRGRIEAALASMLAADGVRLLGDAEVTHVRLDADGATIATAGASAGELRCRVVVDAGATGELTRTQLGSHARERHFAHRLATAWWWVEARLDPASSAGPVVASRCPAWLRWRSTQHFVGPDYWSWLIPLSDGSTSVGIVANADTQGLGSDDLGDQLRRMLAEQEPELDAVLSANPRLDACAARPHSRCFAAPIHPRWLVTGAALSFIDPLYSPGHDLTAIVHELAVPVIVSTLDGASSSSASQTEACAEANAVFAGLLDFYEAIYVDSWVVLADPQLAAVKIGWDQLVYFGWLCPMTMSRWLARPGMAQRSAPEAKRVAQLNDRVQALLRRWATLRGDRRASGSVGRSIDLARLGSLMDRFLALDALAGHDGAAPPEWYPVYLSRARELLEDAALSIFECAVVELGLGLPEGPLNPYAIGLDSERWAGDGLFRTQRARSGSAMADADLELLYGARP